MNVGDIVSILKPKIGFRPNDEHLIVPVQVEAGTCGRVVCFDDRDGFGYMETQDMTSIDFYQNEVKVISLAP